MLGIQPDFTLVETSNLSFQRMEISRGFIRARARLGNLRRKPIEFSSSSSETLTSGVHLTIETNQALAAICRGTNQARESLLFGRQVRLSCRTCRGRCCEKFAVAQHLALELGFICANRGSLRLKLLGLATATLFLWLGGEVFDALTGQRGGRPHPFAKAR